MPGPVAPSSRRYATWLYGLLGLFVLRVVAQPLALVLPAGSVPSFESWHSGALPYGWLLTAQVLIIITLGWTATQFSRGRVTARRRVGQALLTFGGLYFGAMVVRLVLGATWLSDERWFASPIPTFFHLVLASWLLVCGHFHLRHAAADDSALAPWLHYPLVVAGAFGLFAGLQALGLSLVLSTYVPIIATALVVTLLEIRFPYRLDWRPNGGEIRTDLIFMAVVQLALPPLIGFLFVYLLIEPARALQLPVTQWWPHGWPIWIQAILMVLVVDLLRYWLHRWAHTSSTLWRLHAVHHSVEQLYWLNTSRFHPLEKALQMSLDSLPFLLMGVHERVLALYYVAYATNGFFQHCNIDLRYGVLNYIVGSAETHRWHHSRVVRESNSNYGNTVIVWDLLFGTWFLPRDRNIAELGLLDPAYPKSFFGMLGAPFRRR
jgi:sterol desaturase/sphingolipid hydroxylase (fatty acid hydroxylase superfamily)